MGMSIVSPSVIKGFALGFFAVARRHGFVDAKMYTTKTVMFLCPSPIDVIRLERGNSLEMIIYLFVKRKRKKKKKKPRTTKVWAVSPHWHPQEHQGLGCVTTLTPARTPRLH